jgi:hypothetical protein
VARAAALTLVLALLAPATAAAGGPSIENERARRQEWKQAFHSAERHARSRDGRVSVALIDDTGVLRRHRSARRYGSASVVKAMLLVAYLNHIRHRRLGFADRVLLRPMIVRSDNDSATRALGVVGYAGLHRVARRAGMKRFATQPGWSNTQITAADQVRLFIRIDRLVPGRHRRYARGLLRGVVERQRWGIPRAVPETARVLFKGGWRPEATGWLVHQAALVESGHDRVALAVLTDHDRSKAYGRDTIRGIAKRALRPLAEGSLRISRK